MQKPNHESQPEKRHGCSTKLIKERYKGLSQNVSIAGWLEA
jgi:hypothetical protein